jgi:hypothetical protein
MIPVTHARDRNQLAPKRSLKLGSLRDILSAVSLSI